ncbi:ARM repeat-containing protein [Fistulina hepatica ATCC 64428]|uniref:ARM repeat-containing protein n=1 Tax=Fistulina hepatica ATCC 64428 TaxID=1128425 RepID=A0A0D7ABU2_9AGAR|nr:ARM repeat-containing protein [Fistulina hepatica ATCC 64428]
MPDITLLIQTGSSLTEQSNTAQGSRDLKSVLLERLSKYHQLRGRPLDPTDLNSLEEVEIYTAIECISVVSDIQDKLDVSSEASEPLIGTRDVAQLRTLLSIGFKWGVEPLLNHVLVAWPAKAASAKAKIRTVNGPEILRSHQRLSSLLASILRLLFPEGVSGRVPQTLITTALLNRHAVDILRPCITLGWLPKSLAVQPHSPPVVDTFRPLVMRLLAMLPPSEAIVSLGAILSSTPLANHTAKTCSTLLGRQVCRPQGVVGLCAAVFGEGQYVEDQVPLEQLEHVAKVLTSVPTGFDAEEYYNTIIPRMLALLTAEVPLAYKRASAFTMSRMLGDGSSATKATSVLLKLLHEPFLQESNLESTYTVLQALQFIMTLVSNGDPSPVLVSHLLAPVLPALYSLKLHLDHVKTSDPATKEGIAGLLVTWGRLSSSTDGIDTFWSIIQGEGGAWSLNFEGDIVHSARETKEPTLSLLTPEDLKREDADVDIDENILDLYPDPAHFVRFLKDISRPDISSDLFLRLLQEYGKLKKSDEDDPTRTLLYLQLIMQMQKQLSGDTPSSSSLIHGNISHILSFVKHALEAAVAHPKREKNVASSLESRLRIVPDESEESENSCDSDDEETPGIAVDEEMTATAINLLLSILEAHDDLAGEETLNDIFTLLEPLSRIGSPLIRPLAHEARGVLTARMASTSAPRKPAASPREDDAHTTYQRALKLLQDPILPVRAHGLLLLRQLASSHSVDEALVPGILSVFLQCIQDDDSYMYLNAVQGLAAMADACGKNVLQGLIRDYTEGLSGIGGTSISQQDLDTRLRIGEALGTVIRRLSDALGVYVDVIVPPIFNMVRTRHLPTTLRTSALSLLATCVKASPLAMLKYTNDMMDGMTDLLQTEFVPATEKRPAAVENNKQENDETAPGITTTPPHKPLQKGPTVPEPEPPTMDDQPTSTKSKFPPLRRAALHFISQLVRETMARADEPRVKITLAYVSAHDEDDVARFMAREATEELEQLQRVAWGLE